LPAVVTEARSWLGHVKLRRGTATDAAIKVHTLVRPLTGELLHRHTSRSSA